MSWAKDQVMISYQWDSQKQVHKISDALKKSGINIWIDVDEMSRDVFDTMAKAVEHSSIVLVCMTSNYEKSPNCKRELNYAAEKKKNLIPLRLERDYKAGGSLGLITAGKLRFDFTDDSKFEEKLESLKVEIRKQLREPEADISDQKSPADQGKPTDGQLDIAKLSAEKENFFKLTTIFVDIIPKYLRIFFKEQWDRKYPAHKWQSDEKSGEFLVKEIPNKIKKQGGITQVHIKNLEKGNEEKWDTTTLVFALLVSGLELIPKCRAPKERSPPLRISEEIDRLREIRNSAFARKKNCSIKSDEFKEVIAGIKSIAERVFNEYAVREIDRVEKSKLETAVIDVLRQQVQMEIDWNKEKTQMVEEPYKKKGSDDMIKLDLSTEKSNFVKAKKVLLNVVPKYLRQLFKEQWNRKHPDQVWESSNASGRLLLKKLSDRMNSDTDFEKRLTTGNEQKWDVATLVFILLDSGLNLSTNGDMKEDIKVLKGIESSFFADKSKASMSSEDFIEKMDKIKSIARRSFNENAEEEVNDIENSPEERKMKIKLRQLLAKEKSRKRDTDQSGKILEKGYKAQIEFRPEEVNIKTIDDLLLSVIPNHLRRFFKCRWDQQYPSQKWKSNSESGEFLVSEISYQFKTTTANTEIGKLGTGHEDDWGVATIGKILLDSHLQLVTDFETKEGIETLIEIEKSFYKDKKTVECSFNDFKYFAGNIKVASKKVFDKSADDEVSGILKKHKEEMKAVQLEKKVEDPEEYFELTVKEVNFVKITKIVLDVLPKYLRKCFIQHWNKKYSANQWKSDEASGQFLINEIRKKKKKTTKDVSERLSEGNEEKWDTTTLVYVMLFSDLDLVPKCRAKEERVPPLFISEEIDIIRDKRNKAFAHAETMVCSSDEFRATIEELKSVARSIFGKDAENEIDSIAKSQMRMQMSSANVEQLEEAISIHKKLEEALKDATIQPIIDVTSAAVFGDHNTINIIHSHKETERTIDEVSGDLKSAYKKNYQTHQIHAVTKMKTIELREEKISNFAVTLKISHTLPPAGTYKAETRQFLENLIGTTSNDVDLSNLLDENNRVTFVGGVAGIGKSVFAKQLAYKWANHDVYRNFKLLIMFECRKINKFKAKEGSGLKEHKLIDEYIKTKLNCSYGYGEKILFVIDGLDELYDIKTDDSIIWGLLEYDNAKYRESRFIITGRPRVESYLNKYGESVGGIRRVEIQGLNDKQVKEYVKKIARPKTNDYASICQEIESSKRCLRILHVPQFLNTFCCVVIFTEGQRVCCTAELYSWTVYLLLRQHANSQGCCTENAEQIFNKYAQELKALARICFQLLMANTIIFEEDITSLIGSNDTGKVFFQSLFVDISDHIDTKYQFKHLSLVEFLSAFYICCIDEHEFKEHIKDILEEDHIETMVHACEIIANSLYNGMIKKMLYAITQRKINVPEILIYILKTVCDYTHNPEEEFKRSLEVIACFLNEGATEKKSILASIRKLSCGPLYKSVVKDSTNLNAIIKHLKKVHKCSEEEIKAAFRNIQIGEFIVNEVDTVGCVEYLGSVDLIDINAVVTGKSTARSKAEMIGGRKYSFVWIEDCEFNDNEDDIDYLIMSIHELDELVIWNSKLSRSSFLKLVTWGASSRALILDQLKVHTEWWQEMVKAIEKKKASSDFRLSELIITGCKPKISDKMFKRVQHCGVQLIIDGNKFPHNSTKSATAYMSRPSRSSEGFDTSAGRKRTFESVEKALAKDYSSAKQRKDA